MRVAIVEDEKENSDLIEKYLADFTKTYGIDFSVDTFSDGLAFLDAYKPVYDLLFLDIRMPYVDGMEIARRLRAKDDQIGIIFITNMLKYAIKGYEVDAFDFILKPVSYPDFVGRMKKFLSSRSTVYRQELLLSVNSSKVRVAVDDICYLEVDNRNIVYHLTGGQYSVRMSLVKARQQLPDYFVLCNSGLLVNLNYVRKIEQDNVFVLGNWLPISRPKKRSFEEAVAKHLQNK